MGLLSSLVGGVGSIFSAGAEKKAANNQINAWDTARDHVTDAAGETHDASLGRYQPFLQGGQNAFAQAQQMQTPGYQYQPNDPSYAWRFGEGMNALNRSQAARGQSQSGGAMKAAIRYGQGLASTEFGADFNRQNVLAGYGMQGAQGSAQVDGNYLDAISRARLGAAEGIAGAYGAKGRASADQIGGIAGTVGNVADLATKFFGF